MKKTKLVALAFLSALTLCGCGNDSTPEQKITVCFAGDPESIDPAMEATVDGAVICSNAFSGLYGWETGADGKNKIVADCAESVVTPTANDDGSYTYKFTLKEGLKWSDGSDLKASDFEYAWKRAADSTTAADYGYIFDVIKGYNDGENAKETLAVSANNDERTLTVTTASFCAYFNQLLAFPTYYPVKESLVSSNEKWANAKDSYVSNGPFRMSSWTVGSEITFEKNPYYHNADKVKLEQLKFFLSEDDDAVFANFEKGEIDYTTHVPVQQIPVLKADSSKYNKTFFIGDYIGTWYLEFNVNASFKPGLTRTSTSAEAWEGWDNAKNAEVRNALGKIIDRNYLCDTVLGAGQSPAKGFVPNGMSDGNGHVFRDEADDWWSVDAADYDENVQEALTTLKKYYNWDSTENKFTNFPKFDVKMNNTTGNVAILTSAQNQWKQYGIDFEMDQRAWNILTSEVKVGNFTCSRLGWIADYDDPVNFLEIFLSQSGNNHPQVGKTSTDSAVYNVATKDVFGPNHDKNWSEYDDLIASIKTEKNAATRAEEMYTAEKWLESESFVLPMYYYTNPYLSNANLKGYVYTNTGMVYFASAYVA